jgi:hypothetical protein
MESILGKCSKQQLKRLHKQYGIPYAKNSKHRELAKNMLENWENTSEICPICMEDLDYDLCIITPCSHIFCDYCIVKYLQNADECPTCRGQCKYISVVQQIEQSRLYKLNVSLQWDKEKITNESDQTVVEINQRDLRIASVLLILLTTLQVIMCVFVVRYIYHFTLYFDKTS